MSIGNEEKSENKKENYDLCNLSEKESEVEIETIPKIIILNC